MYSAVTATPIVSGTVDLCLRAQRRVMTAIEICRTAALGGHVEQCDTCGHQRICYCSCRNRHCPKCQSLARAQWLDDRRAEVLDTQYFHVVFTLPAEIAAIALQNKAVVYGILFRTVSRDSADDRRRAQASGCGDRLLRRSPHMGVQFVAPSASSRGCARRRAVAGWRPMDLLPVWLFPASAGSLAAVPAAFYRGSGAGVYRRSVGIFLRLGSLEGAGCLPALLGPGPSGRMGGLCKAPVRRTGAGLGVCRPLYTPRRHFQQSHPQYRGWQGSLSVEGLSSRRPAEDR